MNKVNRFQSIDDIAAAVQKGGGLATALGPEVARACGKKRCGVNVEKKLARDLSVLGILFQAEVSFSETFRFVFFDGTTPKGQLVSAVLYPSAQTESTVQSFVQDAAALTELKGVLKKHDDPARAEPFAPVTRITKIA